MDKTKIIKNWTQMWQQAGIRPGDLVLIHSSISRTLKTAKLACAEIGPSDLLQSFIDSVSPDGTVLFPLFNFDFTKGTPFDIRTTPSHMGSLTECARIHPQAIRTQHPLYSFAVIGPKQNLFQSLKNKSGYGADSPFALLRELNGKIAILDLDDQNSMTFYHHVEEMEKIKYRYFKHFTAPYTDLSGATSTQTFSLFVRDIENGVKTDVNRMGELLWEKGAYSGDRPGVGSGLRVIRAQRLFDLTREVIQRFRNPKRSNVDHHC